MRSRGAFNKLRRSPSGRKASRTLPVGGFAGLFGQALQAGAAGGAQVVGAQRPPAEGDHLWPQAIGFTRVAAGDQAFSLQSGEQAVGGGFVEAGAPG
ncbi:MAG: hypothetical protein P8074_21700 [Anaerolineales bacterium]